MLDSFPLVITFQNNALVTSRVNWFSFLLLLSFWQFLKIVVQLQLSCLSPIACPCSIPPTPTVNPPPCPPPCGLCPWVFYTCSLTWSFSFFPLNPPHPSPLVSVTLFFISMSLVLFCSSVLLIRFHIKVRSHGMSFTAWFLWLSIILLSSIHAVEKGKGSFFLLCRIPLCKYTIVFWSIHLRMDT